MERDAMSEAKSILDELKKEGVLEIHERDGGFLFRDGDGYNSVDLTREQLLQLSDEIRSLAESDGDEPVTPEWVESLPYSGGVKVIWRLVEGPLNNFALRCELDGAHIKNRREFRELLRLVKETKAL